MYFILTNFQQKKEVVFVLKPVKKFDNMIVMHLLMNRNL